MTPCMARTGRPPKYKTEEERKAARRESANEWAARNKEQQRAKWREWYHRTKGYGPTSRYPTIEAWREARREAGRKHYSENADAIKAKATAYYVANKARVLAAAVSQKWKYRYRLAPEDYFGLLDSQGGVCACCGSKAPGGKGRLFHVDHDHDSGRVRGLLCHGCNVGIGHFGDDPTRLERAIAYLRGGASSKV